MGGPMKGWMKVRLTGARAAVAVGTLGALTGTAIAKAVPGSGGIVLVSAVISSCGPLVARTAHRMIRDS